MKLIAASAVALYSLTLAACATPDAPKPPIIDKPIQKPEPSPTPQLKPQANQVGNLNNVIALRQFYNSLSTRDNRPVHVVYVGDSHTAADFISGAARDTLSREFGSAGRGLFDAGYPYLGFSPKHVRINSPKSWSTMKSFPLSKSAGGPFGLNGFRTIGKPDGTYSANFEESFDKVAVCANSYHDDTIVNVATDGKGTQIPFPQTDNHVECKTINARGNSLELNLPADAPTLGLSAVGGWRQQKGIVLSSFGVVGSSLRDLAARDEASINNELKVLPPSLIVIAFGTNEGFEVNFNAMNYKAVLREQIRMFRRLAPQASILVMLAPDSGKAVSNRGDDVTCLPLNGSLAAQYPRISHDELGAGYYPPPNLKNVRQAQTEVAREMGVAYWDWFNAMGGECSASALSILDPREIMGDRIHFSKVGATKIGNALANDIINGYRNFGRNLNNN